MHSPSIKLVSGLLIILLFQLTLVYAYRHDIVCRINVHPQQHSFSNEVEGGIQGEIVGAAGGAAIGSVFDGVGALPGAVVGGAVGMFEGAKHASKQVMRFRGNSIRCMNSGGQCCTSDRKGLAIEAVGVNMGNGGSCGYCWKRIKPLE